jgi:uncharacterized protein YebE (UPF0316 family)
METSILSASVLYSWVVLPVLIFCARIIDVSVGTVRVILTSRGYRYAAPALGFIEVLIWLLAIGEIMKNLANPACYVAYAGGFATGNYVGIYINQRLSLGIDTGDAVILSLERLDQPGGIVPSEGLHQNGAQ